ncbi:MAG: hypothetical protein LH475_11275 [Cryobacterium sp.]|uniref:hypothetical protein n=1 Tax=unclassified Cryobacterium TaxID=2649013 RepID=UPI001A22F87D|nr:MULTISPECIES: hypothetical protein [unclassified Cryobacterium]MCY7405186.1 hypothetical protein [Cryobacterium sp.]MEC5156013.1 hypothetical protein [Cryobacterium sp. CAN_C3]
MQQYGWKIGVVAQSHAVVENLLRDVVLAGLEPDLVGKVPKTGADSARATFTALPKDGQLISGLDHAATVFVTGGTAWDFRNLVRTPSRSTSLRSTGSWPGSTCCRLTSAIF